MNKDITIYNHQTYQKMKDCLPAGEWQEEYDFVEFIYKDYKCEILRNGFGALCGYVYTPEDHPLYEKIEMGDNRIDCHWGLTYASWYFGEKDGKIGFDCAHLDDLVPLRSRENRDFLGGQFPETYRNIDYVIDQCCNIVDQLKVKEHE